MTMAAARALPLLTRLPRVVSRLVFRVPPWVYVTVLALAIGAVALSLALESGIGALVGLLFAGVSSAAIGRWKWVTRTGRPGFVVYVSEFSEHSTDASVRAASVHRREMIAKLEAVPGLSNELSIRRLPAVNEKTARRILVRSPSSAVVYGTTTTAGGRVKWTASLLYRVSIHARYPTGDRKKPALGIGAPKWSDNERLQLPVDSNQAIAVLTEVDFPAEHAEGVAAMLLAIWGTATWDATASRQSLAEVRRRWKSAPDAARALVAAGEADVALVDRGWKAWVKSLRKSTRDIHHPHLEAVYVSALTLSCAQGIDRRDELLRAADELCTLSADPRWQYLRGCALMGLGRWQEARDALSPLLRKPRLRSRSDWGPPRAELLAAIVQVGVLTEDPALVAQATRSLRRIPRRSRPWSWRERPRASDLFVFAWGVSLPYDVLARPLVEARLSEIGVSEQDQSWIRLVWQARDDARAEVAS